jgi:integrase
LELARQILEHQMEQVRDAKKLGRRRTPLFYEAAAAYINAKRHLKQIDNTTKTMERLLLYVGDIPIDEVHQAHPKMLQLVDDLRAGVMPWAHGRDHFNGNSAPKPRKRKTIWAYLELTGRVLNFCRDTWRDEKNQPYLTATPTFTVDHLPDDARAPFALTWAQHHKFVPQLSALNQRLYLFDVNTGLRDREIVNLRWEWLHRIDGLGLFAVIPATWKVEVAGVMTEKPITKGGKHDRVVPINSVAASVLDDCRGDHDEFVFVYNGQPVTRVLNTSWKKSRARMHEIDSGFPGDLHFHDVRHTFGHRLKEAGVERETRETLLGHNSGNITDHYSQDDLQHLMRCSEKITRQTESVPVLHLANVYRR